METASYLMHQMNKRILLCMQTEEDKVRSAYTSLVQAVGGNSEKAQRVSLLANQVQPQLSAFSVPQNAMAPPFTYILA
jgi:hypothetical protein